MAIADALQALIGGQTEPRTAEIERDSPVKPLIIRDVIRPKLGVGFLRGGRVPRAEASGRGDEERRGVSRFKDQLAAFDSHASTIGHRRQDALKPNAYFGFARVTLVASNCFAFE